jgi:hypothetical protein
MTRALLVLCSAAVALAGCSSPRCERADAQSLVTALQPETQFRAMLKMFVERTQTYAMANAKDSSGTKVKLDAALDRAVEKYGAEWERNLTSSWGTLHPSELDQACKALAERDQLAFQRFAVQVGPKVKSKNEPLVIRAGTEVLGEIWS